MAVVWWLVAGVWWVAICCVCRGVRHALPDASPSGGPTLLPPEDQQAWSAALGRAGQARLSDLLAWAIMAKLHAERATCRAENILMPSYVSMAGEEGVNKQKEDLDVCMKMTFPASYMLQS